MPLNITKFLSNKVKSSISSKSLKGDNELFFALVHPSAIVNPPTSHHIYNTIGRIYRECFYKALESGFRLKVFKNPKYSSISILINENNKTLTVKEFYKL